ncbi:uncharacterized protein LOC130640680 isoform X2 [Hydractinia symbiolongicarpus]|uniref:uncharacterized protein LOC130640680 isoform X2 n=1 Tax=Hydractinia symbiolongicarpus TaxID=13093 RepID=UPI0025503E2E|nr:uncharacterized protein LOC130640680 isoform X2 [Hydractinia symbiolongicarpus]
MRGITNGRWNICTNFFYLHYSSWIYYVIVWNSLHCYRHHWISAVISYAFNLFEYNFHGIFHNNCNLRLTNDRADASEQYLCDSVRVGCIVIANNIADTVIFVSSVIASVLCCLNNVSCRCSKKQLQFRC